MEFDVSIIICTRNRAESLRATLNSLALLELHDHLAAELLVVDNASTDQTSGVVRDAGPTKMPVRYLSEPRRGQANARNTGIAAARGQVILFTDDDVRPGKKWIPGMCSPILNGDADAVAGGVRIPEHLQRPWMTPAHLGRLACTDWMLAAKKLELVGANMAFSREVLHRVPGFDPALGPGALGLGDDSLFSWQIEAAGLRLHDARHVAVEHHFEPNRLLRKSFRAIAVAGGQTRAYLHHHWKHRSISLAPLRYLRSWMRAGRHRNGSGDDTPTSEGISGAELLLLEEFHFRRRFLHERRLTRNYERHGLARLDLINSKAV